MSTPGTSAMAGASAASSNDDPYTTHVDDVYGGRTSRQKRSASATGTDTSRVYTITAAELYLSYLQQVANGRESLDQGHVADMVKDLGWGRFQSVPYVRSGVSHVVHMCPAIETLRYVGTDMTMAETAIYGSIENERPPDREQEVTNALISSGCGDTLEIYATDLATQLLDAAVANAACAGYIVFRLWHLWETMCRLPSYEFRYYLAYVCQIALAYALWNNRITEKLWTTVCVPLYRISWGQTKVGIDASVPQMLVRRDGHRPWMPHFPPQTILAMETCNDHNQNGYYAISQDKLIHGAVCPYFRRRLGLDPRRNVGFSRGYAKSDDEQHRVFPYNNLYTAVDAVNANPAITAEQREDLSQKLKKTILEVGIKYLYRGISCCTTPANPDLKDALARVHPPPILRNPHDNNRTAWFKSMMTIYSQGLSATPMDVQTTLGIFRIPPPPTRMDDPPASDSFAQLLGKTGLLNHGDRSSNHEFLLYAFGIDPNSPTAAVDMRRQFVAYYLRNFDTMEAIRVRELRANFLAQSVSVFRVIAELEKMSSSPSTEVSGAIRILALKIRSRPSGVLVPNTYFRVYNGTIPTYGHGAPEFSFAGAEELPPRYIMELVNAGNNRGYTVRRMLFENLVGGLTPETAADLLQILPSCRKWIFLDGPGRSVTDASQAFEGRLYTFATRTRPSVMWFEPDPNAVSGLVRGMYRDVDLRTRYVGSAKMYIMFPKRSETTRADFVVNLCIFFNLKFPGAFREWVLTQSPEWQCGFVFAALGYKARHYKDYKPMKGNLNNVDYNRDKAEVEEAHQCIQKTIGYTFSDEMAIWLDANRIISKETLEYWRRVSGMGDKGDMELVSFLLGMDPWTNDLQKWKNKGVGIMSNDQVSTFGYAPDVLRGAGRGAFARKFKEWADHINPNAEN